MLEQWVKPFTLEISVAAEAIAAVIIAFAVIEALWRLGGDAWQHLHAHADVSHRAKEDLRLRLGRWLALSLEFLLAADILRTAVAPTWEEIGKLAAVATIRTALNFFLRREIAEAAKERNRSEGREPAPNGAQADSG